ncbi:hypothetical protein DENIS_3914 [Desulfonema ishimotonii]|uniref:Uncharacterized protein n=1 Tax=Desulfonema ishimotonii TaxID=45657 RepID=A0A401G146_9BACT|nr:hypothetical protein DENIS_3914 [Desulfonema ishimotonii]
MKCSVNFLISDLLFGNHKNVLSSRVLLPDADIAKIVKQMGLETTGIVLEETCERACIVRKTGVSHLLHKMIC